MRSSAVAAAAALLLPLVASTSGAAAPQDGAAAREATGSAGSSPASPPASQPGSRQSSCDPFTDPVYAGNVPTPREALGIDLGEKEVRSRQSNRYVAKVDTASRRVRSGQLATTGLGRPVIYALVGAPQDVRAAQQAARILRNPKTSPQRAARVAARAPAIAWDAANVHGNEESGADAALRVLWDLADRRDCAARQIRDNVVTMIVPIQNPDGRYLDYRRNSYGFDMNRDWFARTQPEIDGMVQLLRRFPAALFIDDHEMGSEGFFFPPNADPVHHEVADRSVRWVNDLYGASIAEKFDAEGIPYFNYDIYDMFYMGYGDSVPMTGFLGAGMTFEKNNGDSIRRRVREQYTAVWASMSALAVNKADVLEGLAASYRQAYRQGLRGRLEPNKVWQPGSTLTQRVPRQRVRNYFLLPTPQKEAEVQGLVRRLQRMDVDVRRLTAPLRVRDFHAYGANGSRAQTLPRGTYWISMAQGQKHWIQAMLGEDSYVPFPYFYDVTAWSGPLLFNVPGGRSGARVEPESVKVGPVGPPGLPGDGPRSPTVGIWYLDPQSTSAYESEGWMRWLYDYKWKLPFRSIKSDRITRRELAGLDVLVAPSGYAPWAYRQLGSQGRQALRGWVADGGRLVTMAGSTELAARMGLTTARLRSPDSDIPGALIRARVQPGPLSQGVGSSVWSFYDYDNVMRAPDRSVAVAYPSRRSRLWSISGFARRPGELAGTAAVVDQGYRDGRVISFAADPNFRGFTDGTQQLLWNAIYRADPRATSRIAKLGPDRAAAANAAEELRRYRGRLVITVRATGQSEAEAALTAQGLTPTATVLPGGIVQYRIAMSSAEQSSYARPLLADLAQLGDQVVAVRLP